MKIARRLRYVAPVYRSRSFRFQVDQRVAARAFLARILWLQGFAEQAMRTAQSNVDEARAVGHPLSLCYALEASSAVMLFAGDLGTAERFMAMLLTDAEKRGFGAWNAWAKCLQGSVHIKRGDAMIGTQLLRTAFEELHGAGFAERYTHFLGALAEGLGLVGQVTDGLAAVHEALARCERTDERWCQAELLRIKGELIVLEAAPGADAAAEALFSGALESARHQGALSWELRCATSLAELWHRQRRPDREQLAAVYERFTEGFDTVDLRTAKALVDRLA
jgi:predicted ATPase